LYVNGLDTATQLSSAIDGVTACAKSVRSAPVILLFQKGRFATLDAKTNRDNSATATFRRRTKAAVNN
jgi:hypothetical protein